MTMLESNQSDIDTSEQSDSRQDSMPLNFGETNISQFLEYVIKKHHLDVNPQFSKGKLEEIVGMFHSQWIFNLGSMVSLPLELLMKLEIPMLLKGEILLMHQHHAKMEEAKKKNDLTDSHSSMDYHRRSNGGGGCPFFGSGSGVHRKYGGSSYSMKEKGHIEMRVPNTRMLLSTDMPSARQKTLLKESWKKINEILDRNQGGNKYNVTEIFYRRFFQASPLGRKLFENKSIEDQAKSLFVIINWIAINVDKLDNITHRIKKLGGRHALYEVNDVDYVPFINQFCLTIRDQFGDIVINDEVYSAWRTSMSYFAYVMIESAKAYEEGHCKEGFIEGKDENQMERCYLKLTLDRLYICSDDKYDQYKGEYSIRGLVAINIIDKSRFIFRITSASPPFSLLLGANNAVEYKSWIRKFSWRISALQHVYDDNDTIKNEDSKDSRDLDNTVSTLNHTIRLKGDDEESEEFSMLSHRDILLKTWKMLINNNLTSSESKLRHSVKKNERVRQFYTDLYTRFISLSPIAKSIFKSSMLRHIPALTKMISLIVNEVRQPDEYIQKIGGMHYIWGVQENDFNCFAIAFCDALQKTLGGEIVNQNVRDAWFKTIKDVGGQMIKKGRKLNTKGINCSCYRRTTHGDWKLCTLFLNLHELFIYRSNKMQKIKKIINLVDALFIDTEDNDSIVKKTDHCITLKTENSDVWFCFETHQESNNWKNQIEWRMDAIRLKENSKNNTNV